MFDRSKPRVHAESPPDVNGRQRTLEIGNSMHLQGEMDFWRTTCGYAVHFDIWNGSFFEHAGSFFPN